MQSPNAPWEANALPFGLIISLPSETLERCPGMGWLAHMVVLSLVFWGTSSLLFSISDSLIYIPTKSVSVPFSPHSCFFSLFNHSRSNWQAVVSQCPCWYQGLFLYISLPFSFEKCLVRLLAHFLKRGLIKIRNVSQIRVVLAERAKLGSSCAEVHISAFLKREIWLSLLRTWALCTWDSPSWSVFFSLPGCP